MRISKEEALEMAKERLKKASIRQDIAEISAAYEDKTWPVRIQAFAEEYFCISGQGSRLDMYITETNEGYLVSVPNWRRCGHVPKDCNAYDVMEYVDIDNVTDAATLSAAVRYLSELGYIRQHPSIQEDEGGEDENSN